jgi:hypothetical protein
VNVSPASPIPDATLREPISNALLANPLTDEYQIQVTVEGGGVTLRGTVESSFESAEAAEVASTVAGVKIVDNQLRVEDAGGYVYYGSLDPYGAYVQQRYYVGGSPARSDATMTGMVDTLREREAATENAFEGGAAIVDNQLDVS